MVHHVAALLLLLIAACGYRPAASLTADSSRTARVPAFISAAADPELDVFAASHLTTRLEAAGVRASTASGDVLIQGYLVSAREDFGALLPSATLAHMRVEVRAALDDGSHPPCETAAVEGTAPLHVPYGTSSEAERLVALREAIAQAIDGLVLDVLLCLDAMD